MYKDTWDYIWKGFEFSREWVDKRIMACSDLGWRYIIGYLLKQDKPFKELRVAELGCGTGTFSLKLSLLGAKATLIDNSPDALKVAKEIFNQYGQEAEFIKADVLEPVIPELIGKFDLVVSVGLAEHFIGENRLGCIRYHRQLLNNEGFAYIHVPNKLNIFYQIVQNFSVLTGLSKIGVEYPYTYWELKKLAEKVGFKRIYIIGNRYLWKDMIDYSLGLFHYILELFRTRLKMFKKLRYSLFTKEVNFSLKKYIDDNYRQALNLKSNPSIRDYLSANIVLFGLSSKT